jgi:hypothetical protein
MFSGYVVLHLNFNDPCRLRFVVTPNIFDGRNDDDHYLFCQGVICDTNEDYISLTKAVKTIELKYVDDYVVALKNYDNMQREFVNLVQKTTEELHAIAAKFPWHYTGGLKK